MELKNAVLPEVLYSHIRTVTDWHWRPWTMVHIFNYQ